MSFPGMNDETMLGQFGCCVAGWRGLEIAEQLQVKIVR
jgi:hypothetical protein